MEMDTDSLYCAPSHETLDDCVPPEKREDYFRERKDWLPCEAWDKHYDEYVKIKTAGET